MCYRVMCGEFLDVDNNGIWDLNDMEKDGYLIGYDESTERYTGNDDPYSIDLSEDKENFIKNFLPMYTDNLSYTLYEWSTLGNGVASNAANDLSFLYSGNIIEIIDGGTKKEIGCDFSVTGQDYEYDDNNEIITEASEFHKLRRETIINLITSVMREEFNEHNDYAKNLGVTYNFNIPDIDRDQWNNTIDDISVLAFMQGMPMGGNSYYNNYSLGGSRIVQANYLYGETVIDSVGKEHKVYHKYYCPLIPKDSNQNPRYSDGSTFTNGTLPDGSPRRTKGIEEIFINSDHAKQKGYYICSECM